MITLAGREIYAVALVIALGLALESPRWLSSSLGFGSSDHVRLDCRVICRASSDHVRDGSRDPRVALLCFRVWFR